LEFANNAFSYFRQNIEIAILKFEASDLGSLVELDTLLTQIKTTHGLLSEHMQLDPFEDILLEVNEDSHLGSFKSRIAAHVYSEIVFDIAPNYIYKTATSRFVRAPVSLVDPVHRVKCGSIPAYFLYTASFNKYFADVSKLSKGYLQSLLMYSFLSDFFGRPHFQALIKLLSPAELAVVIEEVYKVLEYKVNYVLSAYSSAVLEALDPTKLPSTKFGLIGAYGYFELKLKYIEAYQALKSKVFQVIREIGNCLAFFYSLENALNKEEYFDFLFKGYFQGFRPGKPDNIGEDNWFLKPKSEHPIANILSNALKSFSPSESSVDFVSFLLC